MIKPTSHRSLIDADLDEDPGAFIDRGESFEHAVVGCVDTWPRRPAQHMTISTKTPIRTRSSRGTKAMIVAAYGEGDADLAEKYRNRRVKPIVTE